MFHESFLVKPREPANINGRDPGYTGKFESRAHAAKKLRDDITQLISLQERLWAGKRHRVLILFWGDDGAGKSSVIEHIMSGVHHHGCRVIPCGPPTEEELRHPFMWRGEQATPKPGEIVILDRSYYEEVRVVRVHSELLKRQPLTPEEMTDAIWEYRFNLIREFHKGLATDPTCPALILMFFLNASKKKTRKRLIERIDDPDKNWKLSDADILERRYWPEYRAADEAAITATSTDYAPCYVIPADHKWYTHLVVADILVGHLKALKLEYPKPDRTRKKKLAEFKKILEREAHP